MYNPYLPRSWEGREPFSSEPPPPPPPPPPPSSPAPGADPRELWKRLLERFHWKDIDTGDILLLLILIFLFLDDKEDNLEMIITLGLMLIL